MSEQLYDLLSIPGLKIYQDNDYLSFSIDSVLLADFTVVKQKTARIMDFGTGFGPIPLFLSLKTKAKIFGIDKEPYVIEMAKKSVLYNRLENQIELQVMDIKDSYLYYPQSSFDLVTVNPPFFKYSGDKVINTNKGKALARHEIDLTLEDVIVSAKRLLSTGGSLVMVHRADRLEEIILTLNKHHFNLKRMRFVYSKKGKPAFMVLMEAFQNGSTGSLSMLEPLTIYGEDGDYTDEVKEIFRFHKE